MSFDTSKFESWLKEGVGKVSDSPIGTVVESAVGKVYDRIKKIQDPNGINDVIKRNEFEVSLLILAAAVIKADGDVSKFQIEYVKDFWMKNFDNKFIESQMFLLEKILEKKFNLKEVCFQIKKIKSHPVRIQMVQFLFHVADADLEIDGNELKVIRTIAGYLGVNDKDYYSLRSMFLKGKEKIPSTEVATTNYTILEVEKNATVDEIKSAYRRLVKKFHPDKVQHLGEDIKEAAKEKFQQLTEAYDAIMQNKEDR